jgi:hypothetical protein
VSAVPFFCWCLFDSCVRWVMRGITRDSGITGMGLRSVGLRLQRLTFRILYLPGCKCEWQYRPKC